MEDGPAPAEARRWYLPAGKLCDPTLVVGAGAGCTSASMVLLEEAQRAGVPIIALDARGDLANLALAWPELGGGHFAAWLPGIEGDASGAAGFERGVRLADSWRSGLAADGLDGGDIRVMRERVAVSVLTPGSVAGVPVNLVQELARPLGWEMASDVARSAMVAGVVAPLWAFAASDRPLDEAADLAAPEAQELALIVLDAWARHETLDLTALARRVEEGAGRVAASELSAWARKALAQALLSLANGPALAAWRRGARLDVDVLLRPEASGTRTSVFSLAHLGRGERTAFVTLMCERLLTWVRAAQAGATSPRGLRALVYLDSADEHLGPEVASAARRPLLALLATARTAGLGVVLGARHAQLDARALGGVTTWLVGRPTGDEAERQTLDLIMTAAATAGRAPARDELQAHLAALEARDVLQLDHGSGAAEPMRPRFTMSLVRGPMSRRDILRLTRDQAYNPPATASLTLPAPPIEPGALDEELARPAPVDPPLSTPGGGARGGRALAAPGEIPGLTARSLPATALLEQAARALFGIDALEPDKPVTYTAALYAEAQILRRAGELTLPVEIARRVLHPLPESPDEAAGWRRAAALAGVQLEAASPPLEARAPLPDWLWAPRERERVWARALADVVPRVRVPVCAPLGVVGAPGESLEALQQRIAPRLTGVVQAAIDKVLSQHRAMGESLQKKVDELKELLEMDKRELVHVRQQGDAAALMRVEGKVKVRIERYRELVAARDRHAAEVARERATAEVAALERYGTCALRDFELEPNPRLALAVLLWVPSR